MIKISILAVCVVLVAAAPQGSSPTQPPVEVLKQDSFVGKDGYNFEFNSSDGTARQEQGELITVGDKQGIAVKGSYAYVAPDGQHYSVTFTADDKGYKPEIHLVPGRDQPAPAPAPAPAVVARNQ